MVFGVWHKQQTIGKKFFQGMFQTAVLLKYPSLADLKKQNQKQNPSIIRNG